MDVDLSALSDDVVALHQLIGALAAERANERAALAEAQAEIDRLRQIVRQLQRSQFGQRAERWAEDQLRLVFEDLDADFVAVAAPVPAPTRPSTRSVRASAKLNAVEPYAYLKDVLTRLAAGHPWNWAPSAASA